MHRLMKMCLVVGLSVLVGVGSTRAQEASRIFLCIPNVQGTVTVEGFEGCIELLSTSDGFIADGNETVQSRRINVQLVQLVKNIDISSVDFRMAALRESEFQDVEISYVQIGDFVSEYFEIIMTDVLVRDYLLNGERGSGLTETVTLSPARAVWNFYEINSDGSRQLADSFCYNFQSGRTC